MTKATIKEDRSKNQLTHERVHALRLFTKDLKDDKVKDDKDTIILLLKDLKARHIIVSKKYDLAVRRAIDSVKKKYHVRIKHDVSCEALADDVADDDSLCSVHTLESLDLGSVRELTFFLRELD